MSSQSFIDAIDNLSFSTTGKMASKTTLPMCLIIECESNLTAPERLSYARELEIAVRFGGRLFVDESEIDSGLVDRLASKMKSDMKRIAFSDALDFAQNVVAVAAKNGNRELLKMAFDFQDRILKTP